ncbi:Xaa-Pro aminopeptidase, partial [Klebsiella pneumoniae]
MPRHLCPSAANRTGSPQTDITLTKIRSGGVMTQQEFLSRRQTLLAQMQPG